jgi:hypothetical protein
MNGVQFVDRAGIVCDDMAMAQVTSERQPDAKDALRQEAARLHRRADLLCILASVVPESLQGPDADDILLQLVLDVRHALGLPARTY